jgi:integrase
MAWIQTVPLEGRVGSVIPARWRRKAGRVKKEAGLDGRKLQDALRHSYGSYSLAMNQDMASLNAAMGHQHMATYFDHYHSALTKEVASDYWKVLPSITATTPAAAAR